MPRDDEDGDEFDDWPDDADPDEADVAACPSCGAEVYEDAERCPACGEWIVRSTHPFAGRSLWFVGLGLLGIAVTIAALVLAGF
ncbi:MAG TPA: zinc ribbon domain-containing protein [Planctomycetaceae bacterium]